MRGLVPSPKTIPPAARMGDETFASGRRFMALPLDRERRTCWPGILNAGLTRCTWKKASLIAGVVTTSFAAALAAALGTSQAAPTSVPDAATLFRGGGAGAAAALGAIKSEGEDNNGKKGAEAKKTEETHTGG